MGAMHDKVFPGETPEYRAARDELLRAEDRLRAQIEDVAAMRRALPLGGSVAEDYTFDEVVLGPDGPTVETRRVTLSDLFESGRDSLIIYGYMYGEDWDKPCPMCTAIVDNLDGNAMHVRQRANLAVVARAPAHKLRAMAEQRGWRHVRLLSSSGNSFNRDYNAEYGKPPGNQHPVINVFAKRDGTIHHSWASEALWVDRGGDPRHADIIWGLWNLLDLTPEGRGATWYPSLAY